MGDVGVGLGETALAADLAAELASEGAGAVAEGETGNAVASSSCLADKVFSSKSLGVKSRLFGNDGTKYNPTTKLSVGGDLNGARAGALNSRGRARGDSTHWGRSFLSHICMSWAANYRPTRLAYLMAAG